MKYVVQVKYTNPAHEHVSLRRRVETVNRLVEAYDEQEAINRVVRQQRSLGFIVQEATVHKDPDHVDMTPEHPKDKERKKGVVGDDNEETMVKKEPVKESEQIDERNKQNALARKTMDALRGARFKAQGHYVPDPEPQHKTDLAHNKAVGRALRQMSSEEVEIDEGVATAQKVADRAAVVAKTAGDSKKRMAASSLARKAQLRTINPTGVNTGIDRGAGNKATRKMGGVPKYQLDLDKKRASVSEEARPMSAPAYSSVGAKILTGKVGTNFGYAANKMPPHLKAAQAASDKLSKVVKRPQAGTLAAARGMKEEAVKEPPKSLTPTPKQDPNQKTTLSPSNPVVQKDDKLKEATETTMNKKKSRAAQKMVNAAKGKVNKVDFEPTAEIAPTHAHALSMNGKF